MNYRVSTPATDEHAARRRHPRVFCDSPVVLKPQRAGHHDAVLRNLSLGGAFCLSEEKIRSGSQLVLYIPLETQSQKKLCIVSGRVIRTQSLHQPGLHGLGVQFDKDLSPSCVRMLQDYVARHLDHPAEPEEHSVPEEKIFDALKAVPVAAEVPPEEVSNPRREQPSKEKKVIHFRALVKHQRARNWFAYRVVGGAVLVLAVLVGLGVRWIQQEMWLSDLKKQFPLAGVSVSQGVLWGQVQGDWMKNAYVSAKQQTLTELVAALAGKGIYQAILVDQYDRTVATILENKTDRKKPGIHFFQ